MVMIQDSNIPSAAEKPLRISGDPQKCQVINGIKLFCCNGGNKV